MGPRRLGYAYTTPNVRDFSACHLAQRRGAGRPLPTTTALPGAPACLGPPLRCLATYMLGYRDLILPATMVTVLQHYVQYFFSLFAS